MEACIMIKMHGYMIIVMGKTLSCGLFPILKEKKTDTDQEDASQNKWASPRQSLFSSRDMTRKGKTAETIEN